MGGGFVWQGREEEIKDVEKSNWDFAGMGHNLTYREAMVDFFLSGKTTRIIDIGILELLEREAFLKGKHIKRKVDNLEFVNIEFYYIHACLHLLTEHWSPSKEYGTCKYILFLQGWRGYHGVRHK